MKNKFIILSIAIFIIIIAIVFFKIIFKENYNLTENIDDDQRQYDCSITRTFRIVDLLSDYETNDELYSYITLDSFQDNAPETVKILKTYKLQLEINKNYEFVFQIDKENYSKIITKSDLFNYSVVMNVVETDKVGLDQVQDAMCK